MEQKILAMYDTQGIQKYIFKTAKVRDVIGASGLVENIIMDALHNAVKRVKDEKENMMVELQWSDENGPFKFVEKDYDMQVLFAGGGNAYVLFRDKPLCTCINRYMGRYILDKTYSLQMSVAMIEKGEDFLHDYKEIRDEMNRVKAEMAVCRPMGALPIMKVEIKTGYPLVSKSGSTETLLKMSYEKERQRKGIDKDIKQFDSYITEKGKDSKLAVVHIDGNNMGLRIHQMLKETNSYEEAVNRMRNISYHIDHSYKITFQTMHDFFTEKAAKMTIFKEKVKNLFICKILTAGDDITYICNGKIALATVEFFCREISRHTMNGKKDKKYLNRFGFSVCAGVAFMGSHFPFYIGYEVAENCCENAKERAKEPQNMDGERVGNFVDFHITQNIQAADFNEMRKREYQTCTGEQLLIRPYYIATGTEGTLKFLNDKYFAFHKFKRAVSYFQNLKEQEELNDINIPKSFAMTLRNLYPTGKNQVYNLEAFLKSRDWYMPDEKEGIDAMYLVEENRIIARWYDALEMVDDFIDLDKMEENCYG